MSKLAKSLLVASAAAALASPAPFADVYSTRHGAALDSKVVRPHPLLNRGAGTLRLQPHPWESRGARASTI